MKSQGSFPGPVPPEAESRGAAGLRAATGGMRLGVFLAVDPGLAAVPGTGAHHTRTVPARAGAPCRLAGPPTSRSPASSCIPNCSAYAGVFGLTGGLWVPGCTELSRKPEYSPVRRITARSCLTAHTGTCPRPRNDLRTIMAGTPHVPAWRRQEILAVSHTDQSWILAWIVSRRPEQMWSHLACGTGDHHIRPVPPVGRCASRMPALRASPVPARTRIPNTQPLAGISSRHDGRLCQKYGQVQRCGFFSAPGVGG